MQRIFSRFARVLACWNWKCALLSASVRSLVYLVAMAHARQHGAWGVVLVEIVYVTATAGLYAGLQQRGLGLRSRLLGTLVVVLAVPALAQSLDWLTHRTVGHAASGRVTGAVCLFTFLSALFHLYVMRKGAFLTGPLGRTLLDDFRSMPRLMMGFLAQPVVWLSNGYARIATEADAGTAS